MYAARGVRGVTGSCGEWRIEVVGGSYVSGEREFGSAGEEGEGEAFVFKNDAVGATEERLKELEEFKEELVGILELGGGQ